MKAVAFLLAGGGLPEDYLDAHVLGGTIKAANFFDAAKVLDPPCAMLSLGRSRMCSEALVCGVLYRSISDLLSHAAPLALC